MFDLAVGICLGVIMIEMARYGAHVSLNPPSGKRQVKKYTNRFRWYAAGAVVLTIIQGYRAFQAQRDLKDLLARPTIANVDPRPLVEQLNTTDPLLINYDHVFMGSDNSGKFRMFTHSYLYYGDPSKRSTIESLWSDFEKWMKDTDHKHAAADGLDVGIGRWGTTENTDLYLTEAQIKDVQAGKAHIFFVAKVQFRDVTGEWIKESCTYLQSPGNMTSPWHQCGLHGNQMHTTGLPF